MSTPEDLGGSRARIEAGGIPPAAEQRLTKLGEGNGAFTSELSVADFALCDRLRLRPLAQVMGTSVYQVGYQTAPWMRSTIGSFMFELDALSQAWNEARERALHRLGHEARLLHADAVLGVELLSASHDSVEDSLEYTVRGTAVRVEASRPSSAPVLSELSVADYSKLMDAGVELLGVVAWSSVFFVSPGNTAQMMRSLSIAQNQEMPEYTQGVYAARERVIGRIVEQAQEMGASGVIGMRISHQTGTMTVGSGSYERGGMMIGFHAIGTAIGKVDATPSYPPETTVDLGTRPAIDLKI